MSKRNFDKLRVDIYVSGTADKDGNGGYSALLCCTIDGVLVKKTIGGYATNASITRMTLKAIVEALRLVRNKSFIHLYTCIPQVSKGLNKDMYVWKDKNWRRKDGEYLKHSDLWNQAFNLLQEKSLSYKVHYERPFPNQDNYLYVLQSSSKYVMEAKRSLLEVAMS